MIIDDFCYLDGICTNRPDWNLPYVLVAGERAIGKGVYAKAMSVHDVGVQYITVQTLDGVSSYHKASAESIIIIGRIK